MTRPHSQAIAVLLIAAALTGCRSSHDTSVPPGPSTPTHAPQSPPSAPPTQTPSESPSIAPGFHDVFPGVRADLVRRIVEFDGFAALAAHNPQTPRIYLEQVVCSRDTREHESLVVTDIRPSNIHAALLLIGLNPGHPTQWHVVDHQLTATPPAGDRVNVELVYTDNQGHEHAVEPSDWIVNANTSDHFPAAAADHAWVFGGSRIVERPDEHGQKTTRYDADGAGTIIGLTSFGSEIIDWSTPISPEAQVTPPEWIVDISVYPEFNTPIKVRISPAHN